MQKNDIRRVAFFTLISLCVAGFLLVSMQLYFYMRGRHEMLRFSDSLISMEAARASEQLVVQMKKVERLIEPIARDLERKKLDNEELSTRFKRMLNSYPGIFAIGAVYATSDDSVTGGIQYGRSGPAVVSQEQDASSDHMNDVWYKTVSDGKAHWTEPYRDEASGELVVGLAVPFTGGVLYAIISTNTIRDVAGALRFGDTGYGYMLSKNGLFIYHPINAAVESRKTIFEISSEHKTPEAKRIMASARKALAGERTSIDIRNYATSQNFRVFYHPIADTGWVLGAVFSKDEMLSDEGFFRKQKMWMTLSLIMFLTSLSALVFRIDSLKSSRMWLVSSSFSVLCIAGAFYIWHLTLSAPLIEEKDKNIFTDIVSLNRFIETNSRAMLQANKRPPAYVPTGIYIQSLEFEGSNDLNVTGYIWQRYTDGLHDGLKQGFILPEARSLTVKETYRRKSDKTEVVGWYFEATTRQQFDYSKFPFDRPNIWIWIRPADFMNNVVLVPDLASYKFLAPASLPGLQEEVALPGYTFLGSFFDHEYHIRRTNFGMASRQQMDRIPELYYNIIVKRVFVTPFVSKLFPLFIMFAILFVVQLMFSRDEEKKKAFGLSAFAVMGVVITFFFSTLLSHTNLRQEMGSDRIIFIENFHFIAYLMLLLVTIKTLLFIGGNKIRLVQYKNGLIPKLMYWPLFTGLVFTMSFTHFYR